MGNVSEKERINQMIETVMNIARGDYSVQVKLSEKSDDLDSLAMGLNMMIDDIRNSYQKYQATQDATLNILEDLDRRGEELITLNKQLQDEIMERKRTEEALNKRTLDLNERVKEQACIYGIDMLEKKEGISIEGILQQAVQLIPSGWQYTEITGCRITIDGVDYKTENFKKTKWLQKAGIIFNNKKNGVIEVCYLKKKPDIDEGPFSKEERDLINAIAGHLGGMIERKRAEDALKESEEKYRDLFENANDLIQSVDAKGRFVYVNKKWLNTLGYSESELKQLRLTDIIREDKIPHCMEIFKDLSAGKEVNEIESVFIAKDGREIYIEGSANARFKDGIFLETRGIFRDATERNRAEEKLKETLVELERSNKELEHFAYVASHDLQEPLRMVSNYVQLLQRRYEGKLDKDADEFIAFAVDGAKRMQQLINDLLEYSRVGTRGKPFESTDSETVFESAMANLMVAIEESGAVIKHEQLPTVMADSSQLPQLFQNLIGNAIKFKKDGVPEIEISAEKKENEWLFSVSDNGIGIDQKNQERIFQIFQRLHSRSEYDGTGIGLAVCKRIVERHGGRIWVESEPEKGAAFYFTIPTIEGEKS